MWRPNPVPPERRVVDTPVCSKRWNSRSRGASSMPIPVSATTTRQRPAAGSPSTTTRTPPDAVNFIALPTRFSTICFSRSASTATRAGSGARGSSSSSSAPIAPSRRAAAASSCRATQRRSCWCVHCSSKARARTTGTAISVASWTVSWVAMGWSAICRDERVTRTSWRPPIKATAPLSSTTLMPAIHSRGSSAPAGRVAQATRGSSGHQVDHQAARSGRSVPVARDTRMHSSTARPNQ